MFTDVSGLFRFSNLTPGNYTLSEVVQPGYENTSAKTLNVTLQPNQTLNVTNTFGAFGNAQRPATIYGIKYLDPNMNGTYDPGASFVTRWGSYGSANGSFNLPFGVCSDPSGFIYVVDTNNHRYPEVRFEWRFYHEMGLGMAAQTDHSVIRLGSVRTRPASYTWQTPAIIVSRSLIRVAVFVTAWGSYGSANGSFLMIRLVSVHSSGFIYVADTYNDRVPEVRFEWRFCHEMGLVWQRKRVVRSSVWCFFGPVRLHIRGRYV